MLMRARKFELFDKRMQEAIDCLSENAADANDAVTKKEEVVTKDRQRHEKESAGDENEAARVAKLEQDLETMKEKVDTMTQRMDMDLQKMLDTREYFRTIRPVLEEVANETSTFARLNPTQTQPSTQTRSRRRGARNADASDENEDEDEEEEEEYPDFDPTDPTNAQSSTAPAPPAPMTLFKSKLSRRKDRYQNLNARQRYGKDNDYVSFRGVVHASRFGDDVPVPHESTWFTNDGVAVLPQPGVTDPNASTGGAEDSDDDLQIARETISTKCPLTLQEFRDPFSSRLCRHTFERGAILGLLNDPSNRVTRPSDNVRAVRCPVGGCSALLTTNDLHTDAVIMRKIRRIQKANKEAEESEDEGDADGTRGDRTRPQEIESGDESDGVLVDDVEDAAGREREAKRIKMERASGRVRR